MIRIAFTPEKPCPDEHRAIAEILDSGWDRVHLRHPGASAECISAVLDRLPDSMHGRIVLHQCFELAGRYAVGGLHLNSRCPILPPGQSGTWSRSCHTLEEVERCAGAAYVTLSPVFDSISKPGYLSAADRLGLDRLPHIAAPPVIALGGVTPANIGLLEPMGFAGAAVLGYLAEGFRRPELMGGLLSQFNLK